MSLDAATVEVVKWLTNQGVAVAVLAVFLWRLDSSLRLLIIQQRQILDALGITSGAASPGAAVRL